MSQTETLMFVALGFAIALLLALLFGRGIWNVAVALGARRNAKNMPLQMIELQADRDRLRAEHAMMSRKLELRLEDIKARMTEQMAEVSRSRNRVQSLIQQLDESEAVSNKRQQEIEVLTAQIALQKSEIDAGASSLSRLMSESAAKDLEMTKLSQSVSQLSLTLREKNGVVSRLSEELQASLRINTPPGFTNPNTENSDDRIKRRITELTSISAQMNAQEHSEAHNLNPPVTNVQLFEAPNRRTNPNDTVTDIERGEMPELNLEAAEPEVKSSARANIISLAQRIRALQGSGGG